MERRTIEQALESLIDQLAAIEHERWAHWQQYVHDHGNRRADGSLVLPAELVSRWDRQISLSFTALDESEKDSDREQVLRYLPIIADELAKRFAGDA